MALLEDPTIQRILDDVNKAATGGVLGLAGSYISEPTEAMTQFQPQLSSSENNFFNCSIGKSVGIFEILIVL